ncbi:MAG: CBS domain-containing protein [Acidobacteriota bacterium]|nr:CBS domain-containing protein [Acidobacteriota bacterium]
MKVREIMTKNPACCTPDTSLQEIAQMMVENDCGCIPVVDSHSNKKPVGTITDRDITVRAFASGQNPLDLKASNIMTTDIISVRPGSSVEQCCDVMESKQIRRVLVVDESGKLAGIVAQADVAEFNTPRSGELVREISEAEGTDDIRGFNTQQRHFSTQQRNFSTNYNQQNRRQEQKMWGRNKQQSGGFMTGAFLPLLLGVGAAAAISFYLNQQEDTSRLAMGRRTMNTNLNPGNTGDRISSDNLAPTPITTTGINETTSTRTTSTNLDDDTGNNMSFGTSAGRS